MNPDPVPTSPRSSVALRPPSLTSRPSARRLRPALVICWLSALLVGPWTVLGAAAPARAQDTVAQDTVVQDTVAQDTVAQASTAQESPSGEEPPGDDVFYETVDVNVVNLEVYVTDKKGNPVTGLTEQDFELYEDGERVEITNFYAVEDAEDPLIVRGDRLAGETPPEGAETEVREARLPPEDRRLYLVVYIDQMHLTPPQRNRVLEGLEAFLEERLARGDRVAVVSSHPSFEILTPFTTDSERVLEGLRATRKRTTGNLAMDRRILRTQLEQAANDPGQLTADQLLHSIQQYADKAEVQFRREMDKLRSFVTALAALPGRKAVVHLSEGISTRPGEKFFVLWEAIFGRSAGPGGAFQEATRHDLTDEVVRLVQDANAAGVTFYTLDALGDHSMAYLSPEYQGLSGGGTRVGGPEVEAVGQINAQTAIQMMAGETGGVPVLNANFPWNDLAEVAETFDTWYSLGYVPEKSRPGEYRNLEVKVKRSGLKVRHREGFQDFTSAERVENETVAALLLEKWSNPLRAYLEPGEADKKRRKRFQMPLEVKVPLERVTFLPGPQGHRALLRVRVAFQELDGSGFGVGEETLVPLQIPAERMEDARGEHITVALELVLEPGPHRLTVGVWDEVGAQASFIPYDVVVGPKT